MKIVVFGAGKFYEERRKCFINDDIIAILDNDLSKWGNFIDDIKIYSPSILGNIEYDYVVIASRYVKEIKEQLIRMGISNEKILFFEQYKQISLRDSVNYFIDMSNTIKSVLIVFTYLCNDGGTMAIWNAAKAFRNCGYKVYIFVMGGTDDVIRRIKNDSIDVLISERLDVMTSRELLWINQFNLVIVNTFLICNFAFEAAKNRKIFWWLHDPKISYLYNYEVFCRNRKHSFKNISMIAVSNLAKMNFNSFFPEVQVDIFPYYISNINETPIVRKRDYILFSYVGMLSNTKGIDILLDVFDRFMEVKSNEIRLNIVGTGSKEMVKFVTMRANHNPLIDYKGELNRDEINIFYSQIDVLVCPSREDMLPTVVVEAMQHKKVCIVSDGTGMADYIENELNGLIFESENADSLFSQIEWIVNNREQIDRIGMNGYKIYKDFFTEKAFRNHIFHYLVRKD